MAKYLSGKSKKTPQSALKDSRYKYLSVGDAEPNLGDPDTVTFGNAPPFGSQYQLISVDGYPGERYWIPVGGGLIPGSITIFNEGTLVGGISSTTQLNIVGTAITAQGINTPIPGVGVTIAVFAPGNNTEILFNTANDFSTSSRLTFDSSVGLLSAGDRINVGSGGTVLTTLQNSFIGIGTTNPTQKLHVDGNIRLTGTIYDQTNNPGNPAEILVKNNFGGLVWASQSSISAGAGGTYKNIQYHNSAGLIDGASNFVFDPTTSRVGIGSTIPKVLLDVLGISSFTGQTNIDNLSVTGVATISKLDVSNLTTLKDLKVTGISTFDQRINVTGGVYVDNVRIAISSIFTNTGNLTIDSVGGTTTVDDNLTVGTSGLLRVNNTTQSTSSSTGSLIVSGGAGIARNVSIGGSVGIAGTLGVTRSISVGGTSFLQDNVTLGNDLLPLISNLQNIGSPSLRWNAIYVNTLDASSISGNADSATRLQTARTFSISGDATAPSISFDGTANVNLVTTLNNSGVSAGTYGSSTQVATITVNSKGIVTAASNVAIDFVGATVGQSNLIRTQSTATNASFFPTFVDSNNATAAYENLYTDGAITYNPSTDLLTVTNLTVTGTSTFNGNVTFGDATTDTVSFTSRINSSVLPSTDGTLNLGGTSNRWNNVYANNFVGTILGNADTATKLTTPRTFSISGDTTAPSVSFDGSANVNLVTTLNNSGVTADTYGSSTQVPVFTVDSKGRITSVTNTGINFSTATASQSDTVRTQSTATNASFFPTFVDSNNATAAYENLYTDAQITYNPSTDLLTVTNLTVNGNVTFGDATTDTVSFTSRINSSVLPSTDGTLNLGGTSNRWNNVYANNFVGTILGNADSATRATYATNAGISTNLKGGGASQIPYQSNTDTTAFIPNGTAGQLLQSNGTSAPSWVNATNLTVDNANFATNAGISTNLKGGSASQIPYQSSTNTTAFIPNGTAGQLLQSNGTSAPSWVNPSNLTIDRVTYATNAGISTNLKGGGASQIPYQSNTDTTAFIPNGTAGQLLQSNGTSAPSWVNPSGLNVGIASNLNVTNDTTNANRYFIFSSVTNGVTSALVDSNITYNPSTDLLTVTNLTTNGNVTFGDATTDTVSFTSTINSSVLPSTDGTLNLGGTSNKWNNVYANTFVGAVTGNADTATKLQTARNIAITGDLAWNVNFDGSANVTSTGTLSNSGVSQGTYGSSTQIPVITVDSKGRITSATTQAVSASGSVPTLQQVTTAGNTTTNSISVGSITTSGNITFSSTGTYIQKNFPDNAEEYILRGNALSAWNPIITYTRSTGTSSRGFKFGSHDNGGNRLTWLSIWDGKLGIGVDVPQSSLHVSGNSTFIGGLFPSANNTYDLGSASFRWNNVYANNTAKAWVTFNSTTLLSPFNPSAAYNVTSISRISAGRFTINFATAFADTNYCVSCSGGPNTNNNNMIVWVRSTSTNSMEIQTVNSQGTLANYGITYAVVYR